jgi:hypothetical protein
VLAQESVPGGEAEAMSRFAHELFIGGWRPVFSKQFQVTFVLALEITFEDI